MEANLLEQEPKVSLVLTRQEASYLKGLVQNYLGVGELKDEPSEQRAIRMDLWYALESCKISLL